MDQSFAPSTIQQYHKAWERCQHFVTTVLQQRCTLPISYTQLKLYIAYLHNTNYKHSTILTNLSAISHYHKMANLPNPTSYYATTKLMAGVRNSQQIQPDSRRPITKIILHGLLQSLKFCAVNTYQMVLYHSMFTLMYYACLRASESTLTDNNSHLLQLSNIEKTSKSSYKLNFQSFKHSTQPTTINVTSTYDMGCPVISLHNYLAQRGSSEGPLFINNSRPITRQALLKTLHQCIKFLNLPLDFYNLHSFRIGRTTDLAQANTPHLLIQKIGRWKSNAFLKYIRPQDINTNP